MSEGAEFDAVAEIMELPFVIAISPVLARDFGYDKVRDKMFTRSQPPEVFKQEFQQHLESNDGYPVVYEVALDASEQRGNDMEEMIQDIEAIVAEYEPYIAIGEDADSDFYDDEAEGLMVPVVDILCVEKCD